MARSLRIGGAVLVVVLVLVVAGCGGSSSSSSSATTTTTTTTNGAGTQSGAQSAAFKAFQTCLADAGIKTNFGGGRPGGTRPAGGSRPAGGTPPAGGGFGGARNLTATQQKAFTACQAKLPAGAGRGGFAGRPNGGATSPALAKYTTCLKQHGVTLGASTKPATFKKASAACAKVAPAGAATQ
jgi:hypothetical protein